MINRIIHPALLASLLLLGCLGGCKSDKQPTNEGTDLENQNMLPPSDTMAMLDEATDDPYWYSYNYTEEATMDSPSADTKASDKPADKAKAPAKKPKVSKAPVIYTVSQTDRPPLFQPDCLTAKNPQRCSNNALADWARKSVKYPEADLADGSDGLEYVTFVINKNGEVTAVERVESRKEACEGCSKAVLTAVLDMPNWQPAMLNGKPVDVVVTLPVRFRVI